MLVVKQFNAFILSAFYFLALALHLQRHKCLLTHRRKKKSGFFMGKSNKQLSSIIIPTVNIVTNQGFPGRRGWGNFRTVYDSTLSIGVYMSGLGTISVFYVLCFVIKDWCKKVCFLLTRQGVVFEGVLEPLQLQVRHTRQCPVLLSQPLATQIL